MIILIEFSLLTVLGLIFGSFITMASFRLANSDNKNISKLILEHSHCPKCNQKLAIKNLIPIFSWLFQKGKCSYCHKEISIRYPLIELATVISFLLIYLVNGSFDKKLIILLLTVVILIIMVINDLEHYFISDIAQISLLLLSLISHLLFEDKNQLIYFALSGLAAAIFGLFIKYGFLLITKKDGLGIDDVKFFGVAGFLLGIKLFPFFMILSGLLGIVFGKIWIIYTKEETFPFAPAICLALILTLVFKNQLTYLI